MEQKLNIKLLEEQNGYLKAVDSTSIPNDTPSYPTRPCL